MEVREAPPRRKGWRWYERRALLLWVESLGEAKPVKVPCSTCDTTGEAEAACHCDGWCDVECCSGCDGSCRCDCCKARADGLVCDCLRDKPSRVPCFVCDGEGYYMAPGPRPAVMLRRNALDAAHLSATLRQTDTPVVAVADGESAGALLWTGRSMFSVNDACGAALTKCALPWSRSAAAALLRGRR